MAHTPDPDRVIEATLEEKEGIAAARKGYEYFRDGGVGVPYPGMPNVRLAPHVADALGIDAGSGETP